MENQKELQRRSDRDGKEELERGRGCCREEVKEIVKFELDEVRGGEKV